MAGIHEEAFSNPRAEEVRKKMSEYSEYERQMRGAVEHLNDLVAQSKDRWCYYSMATEKAPVSTTCYKLLFFHEKCDRIEDAKEIFKYQVGTLEAVEEPEKHIEPILDMLNFVIKETKKQYHVSEI